MKPFDLNKALQDHPLVTRDGRNVTDFQERLSTDCTMSSIDEYPYKAKVEGCWYSFTEQGIFHSSTENNLDLFLKDCDWKPIPKMGDEILVSSDRKDWQKRIFIKLGVEVICVDCNDEFDFIEGYSFNTESWEYWKWPEEEKESVIDKITPYMNSIQENWAKIKAYLEEIEGADKEKP